MLQVPTFAVIGGGMDGAYYVRQLLRAVAARKLATGRIVVVDRRADCEAAAFGDPRVEVAISEWSDWLDLNLHELPSGSHLVPYHWAPHLLVEWLRRTVEKAGRRADAGGPMPSLGLPFERETKAGDRALSYATWTCPVTCIEPVLCPPHPRTEGLEPRSGPVTSACGIRWGPRLFLPTPRLGSRLDPGGFDTRNGESPRRSAWRAPLQRRHVQPLPRLGNHAAGFLSRGPTPARRRCSCRPGRRHAAWGWPDRG